MKKILISCYYGEVFIEATVNTKRNVITEGARRYFQELSDRPITDLSNFSYKTEYEWIKNWIKDIDKGNDFLWETIPTITI